MEALAALGGMNREALHSQLAAAVRIVVGVSRTAGGARGIAEIGLVSRNADGWVTILPIWLRNSGFTDHRAVFDAMVEERA